MQHSANFEEIKIGLPQPFQGVDAITAVVGIPEWWPTGDRVAVAIAHDAGEDLNDPLIDRLHRHLTANKFLSVRFNFPSAEAGTPSSRDTGEILERTYRAALSILGPDGNASPSHLFIGGKGVGGRVAAHLATARIQIDGAFFLSYPLHAPDKPEQANPDYLYRIISPMLFVQGTEDRRCDLPTLRATLSRVGASTTLHTIRGADHRLDIPAQRLIDEMEVGEGAGKRPGKGPGEEPGAEKLAEIDEVGIAVNAWMQQILQRA